MESANPYDLSAAAHKGVGPAGPTQYNKFPAKEYTPAEQEELLEGYHEVAPELWDKIPQNAHIRALKGDGKFLRGGFVRNHWVDGEGQKTTTIKTTFDERNSGYKTFPLKHTKLAKLWKKDDATVVSVADFAGIMRTLVTRVEKLETDLGRLTRIVGKLAKKS